MNNVKVSDDGTIEFSQWVVRGDMIISRECLNYSDPDHPLQIILSLGLEPKDYGFEDTFTFTQLRDGISNLRFVQGISAKEIVEFCTEVAYGYTEL